MVVFCLVRYMNIDGFLLIELEKISKEKGINLTLTHKKFFIKMLKYAMENGDDVGDAYVIDKAVRQLSEILDTSLRMVIQSLHVLSECGVIERVKGKNTFPRSATKTVISKSILKGWN